MELLPILAAYGTVALVVVIVLAGMLAGRGEGSRASVLIERVLRRQGDGVAGRALASGNRDFALAVQRCLSCHEAVQCRAWLASGAREGYESFCPNARYVRRMKELGS